MQDRETDLAWKYLPPLHLQEMSRKPLQGVGAYRVAGMSGPSYFVAGFRNYPSPWIREGDRRNFEELSPSKILKLHVLPDNLIGEDCRYIMKIEDHVITLNNENCHLHPDAT